MHKLVVWKLNQTYQKCVDKLVRDHVILIVILVVIAKYLDAVKKIEFEETPDYDYLRKILKEDLVKHK